MKVEISAPKVEKVTLETLNDGDVFTVNEREFWMVSDEFDNDEGEVRCVRIHDGFIDTHPYSLQVTHKDNAIFFPNGVE